MQRKKRMMGGEEFIVVKFLEVDITPFQKTILTVNLQLINCVFDECF